LLCCAMHTERNKGHAILRHTEFKYPHPETLLCETRVPQHQQYNPRRSRQQNDRAFVRFLATIEALYCPTGRVKAENRSHLTVYLDHDTPTCFICDKMTTNMHQLRHRKDDGQYLRFGPVPSPHEPTVFAMTGVNLNVNTSGEFSTGVPMCSTCFAARQHEPRDHFSPEVHEAECKAAKAIMHRQWKKGLSWDVCTSTYPEGKLCGSISQ